MNTHAGHESPHDVLERRSLQPLRDPVSGTQSDDPAAEGPPLTAIPQDDPGPYWTVLHCTFDLSLRRR